MSNYCPTCGRPLSNNPGYTRSCPACDSDQPILISDAVGVPLPQVQAASEMSRHRPENREDGGASSEQFDESFFDGINDNYTNAARHQIILLNDGLIKALQREPRAVFDLAPRKFEEVLADLLADQGYKTQLTPERKDGGFDIYAWLDTPNGPILTLVEAKRYRQTNPVGVGIVRKLHSVVETNRANRGMLVTTSHFTRDARQLQQKEFEYRISLQEFADFCSWLHFYKTRR